MSKLDLLEKILLLIFMITLIVSTFFITKAIYKKEPKNVYINNAGEVIPAKDSVRTIKDTIYSKGRIDTVRHFDTLYITPDSSNIIIAETDTTLIHPNYSLSIKTQYLFPPINTFIQELDFKYKEIAPIIDNNISTTQPPSQWESIFSRFKLGIGTGVSYGFTNKMIEPCITVGVFYVLK